MYPIATFTAPGRWRKGVGRALCETAERHLHLGGFIEVTLWVLKDNERAVKFYQSSGFVLDVGHEKGFERGGKTLTEVRLRKGLSPAQVHPPDLSARIELSVAVRQDLPAFGPRRCTVPPRQMCGCRRRIQRRGACLNR
jgi:hypothetical protein